MNEELRKRIEEVAIEYAINDDSIIDSCDTSSVSNGFIVGAEYGYKEAIKVAKEWLVKQDKDWSEGYGLSFSLNDFERSISQMY